MSNSFRFVVVCFAALAFSWAAATGRTYTVGLAAEVGSDRHLIMADGLIFTTTSKGDLVMGEPTADGFKELGRFATDVKLAGDTRQMTIANGRLYVRGKKMLACHDVAGKK